MSLRDLPNLRPIYILPHDDLVREVLVPGLREAMRYDCMTGFFSSASLRQLAPGLAEHLLRTDGRMRLLVSPVLSPEDQEALRAGSVDAPALLLAALESAYGNSRVDEDAITKHTLRCLAYLIAAKRIQLKVAVVRGGIFHPKVWILDDGSSRLVVHGSNNLTRGGLTSNVEQISVVRSWGVGESEAIVDRLDGYFSELWTKGRVDDVVSLDFPTALAQRIVRDYSTADVPTPEEFWDAFDRAEAPGLGGARVAERPSFEIPAGLAYTSGDFAHQGHAVDCWEANGRRGILEMATGSGKTLTSLIAANRLLTSGTRPLLIVIAAPFLPLIRQWNREALKFGLRPTVPGDRGTRSLKLEAVQKAVRSLRLQISDIECVIVTQHLLCDDDFKREINRFEGSSLLIADEVRSGLTD